MKYQSSYTKLSKSEWRFGGQAGEEPAHVTAAESRRTAALATGDEKAVAAAEAGLVAAMLDCQYGTTSFDASTSQVQIKVRNCIWPFLKRPTFSVYMYFHRSLECPTLLMLGYQEELTGTMLRT